jgi:hypothetical protein
VLDFTGISENTGKFLFILPLLKLTLLLGKFFLKTGWFSCVIFCDFVTGPDFIFILLHYQYNLKLIYNFKY